MWLCGLTYSAWISYVCLGNFKPKGILNSLSTRRGYCAPGAELGWTELDYFWGLFRSSLIPRNLFWLDQPTRIGRNRKWYLHHVEVLIWQHMKVGTQLPSPTPMTLNGLYIYSKKKIGCGHQRPFLFFPLLIPNICRCLLHGRLCASAKDLERSVCIIWIDSLSSWCFTS